MNGTGYGMGGGGYGQGGGMNGGGGYNPYGNAINTFGGGGGFSPYGYPQSPLAPATPGGAVAGQPTGAPGVGRTGEYLGVSPTGEPLTHMPHIIPNPFDNTIMVQGT